MKLIVFEMETVQQDKSSYNEYVIMRYWALSSSSGGAR